VDDVKALLTEFADRAVRRIRARRRVTGVLCVAAATTAVLAVGNQVNWWNSGSSQVAEDAPSAASGSEAEPTPAPLSAAPTAPTEGTFSMYSAGTVALVANKESWSGITCSLAPQGWKAQRTAGADHVLLTPPNVRTAELKPDDGLELRALPEARRLQAVRATQSAGKVFHLGTTDGREAGQVLLGERWLLVQLPTGNQDWNDELLRRFMASCQVN
jgi:hypothetical protein